MQASAQASELGNRLRLADRVLRSIAADVASRGHEATRLGATEKRYFEAVAYIRAGEAPLQLLGSAVTTPALPDPMPAKLAAGDSVIVAVPQGEAAAHLVMLRGLARSGSAADLLVAQVAADYLWDQAGRKPGLADICVRDASGSGLHCSSPRALAALRALPKDLPAAAGSLDWRSQRDHWSGAYQRLDLAAPVASGSWTVLAITASPGAGQGRWPGPGWRGALIGAALLAALATLVLMHRRRAGAAAPTPNRPAPGRPDPGGVAATGRAANLSLKMERQRNTIRAMAELDRASLSRANAQRLVELALGQLLECTGCEVLLVALLDHTVSSRMQLVLAQAGDAETQSEHKALDASTSGLLAIPPDGIWVAQVREFTLLETQAQRGVTGALLLPLYQDARPVGVISLGFAGSGVIGTDEAGNARALAARLGAALTSAARDEALLAQTHFDATTALPNWHYLKEHLGQLMSRARRDSTRLALLFIDLDGFKKVNRSRGHSRGDMVLAEAASRMRGCVREEDLVTRFGGDEFVVVLPRVAEGVDARRVADKLITALAQPYLMDGEEHHLGCTIGISVFPDDAQGVDGMLRSADSALFDAKAAGRGRYAFFDAGVNRAALDRTELEQDLRHALAHDEFSVAYQPQIDLRSGRIDGAEALVRWRHPRRGMVPPVEFIAVAEQAGLIAQIGEFVMRAACTQFAAWDAQGIAPQRIAVNLSGLEIARTDILARVESVLRDTGLRPLHLEVEITEGISLDDTGSSLDKLRALQQRGVRISVDDFGTGYSSLSYLQRLPIDVVKIDQSFVGQLGTSQDSRSIVRAILQVAHSLGKLVVAEGVETDAQRALLAELGCDIGQGYLWSRPLAAVEFADFCRAWRPLLETQEVVV